MHSAYEGVCYPCNHCNYQATTNGNLQEHIEFIHDGICHPGKGTTNSSLKEHIQSIQEGVRYPCNQCDYKAI